MQVLLRTCWVNTTCKLLLMIQVLVCQFPTRKWWFISGPPGGTEGAVCSAYISRSVTARDTISMCHMLRSWALILCKIYLSQWHFFFLIFTPFLSAFHFLCSVFSYSCYLAHLSVCLLISHSLLLYLLFFFLHFYLPSFHPVPLILSVFFYH
jgi:hypothetical protein